MIPKRRNRRRSKQIVEPELRTIIETPVATMANTRTMSLLLQAPTEGYGDAIVNFELKVGLLTLTTNLKNDITNFQQRFDETFSEAWDRFKDLLGKCPHHSFSELHQIDTFYNALTQSDQDSLNAAAGVVSKISATTSSSTPAYLPEITALTNAVKAMLLQNKTPSPAPVKAIEETCVTCGGPHPYYECLATDGNTFNASAATGTYNQGGSGYRPQGETNYHASNQMRPPGFPQPNVQNNQNRTRCKLQVSPIPEPDVAPKPNPKLSIPYPSRLNNQKLREKANNQMLEFLQIFQRLHFDISFADALPHMTKFAFMFKSLRSNKQKLFELANTPLNENCSAVLLKKLPKKLGDPSKLSLPELTPTRMTLELANRSVAYLVGVAEDVFMKVGKFHFLATFVVVDYDVDPRVPLILRRSFLRTAQALIDVHGKELTLRVNDEAITFNVGHTLRYSYRYDDELINQIDVIDVTCEEYAQEELGYSDSSKSGNPTPSSDPIITTFSPHLTPFEGGDFVLEEIKACLTSDSIPLGIDDVDFDPEGDILLLEKLLNDDPSSPLPPKELNFEELKMIKSSIDDPSLVTGWRVCFDYQKLNDATRKDHFLLPFMDQMLERLAGNKYYCFLDRFFEYFHIPIDPQDQEKTTFTCPYGTFAYRCMAFGFCNAPGTFQRCMMAIFHDMIEETMEVFMDDFSIFEDSFSSCLSHLDMMLKQYEDTNLVLNWETCHFMVKKGVVLGHKISKSRIEVDRAKVDVIAKLPHPTSVKGAVLGQLYTDHSAIKYLLTKQDAKPTLLRWILLLQEFDVIIHDKKGAENLAVDHLSRLENPNQGDLKKRKLMKHFLSRPME
ncbi:reverse transcriptase domain-containing protein [Tanacetum coccineum]